MPVDDNDISALLAEEEKRQKKGKTSSSSTDSFNPFSGGLIRTEPLYAMGDTARMALDKVMQLPSAASNFLVKPMVRLAEKKAERDAELEAAMGEKPSRWLTADIGPAGLAAAVGGTDTARNILAANERYDADLNADYNERMQKFGIAPESTMGKVITGIAEMPENVVRFNPVVAGISAYGDTGSMTEAAKEALIAKGLGKAFNYLQNSPLGTLAKQTAAGAGMGGVAAAQGGDTSDVLSSMILGGGMPVGGSSKQKPIERYKTNIDQAANQAFGTLKEGEGTKAKLEGKEKYIRLATDISDMVKNGELVFADENGKPEQRNPKNYFEFMQGSAKNVSNKLDALEARVQSAYGDQRYSTKPLIDELEAVKSKYENATDQAATNELTKHIEELKARGDLSLQDLHEILQGLNPKAKGYFKEKANMSVPDKSSVAALGVVNDAVRKMRNGIVDGIVGSADDPVTSKLGKAAQEAIAIDNQIAKRYDELNGKTDASDSALKGAYGPTPWGAIHYLAKQVGFKMNSADSKIKKMMNNIDALRDTIKPKPGTNKGVAAALQAGKPDD